MTTVHVVLMVATAAANLFSATADFLRLDRIRAGMARVGVPVRMLPWLGVPKAAAVVGLGAGFAVRWLGLAAAGGLIVFYLLAITTHLRAGDHMIGLPVGFLTLATATFALGVAV